MKRAGFTIIELMVVMLVIAILVGVTIPRFKGMQDQANISKAEMELKTLQTAVESYYINQNPRAYPSSTETLASDYLVDAVPNIVSSVLYDPFRSGSVEYGYYRSDNGNYYVITSVGPDGAADITGIDDTGALTGTDDDDIYATNGVGFAP